MNEFFSLDFFIAEEGQDFQASVYSVTDFLGDLGGFIGICTMISTPIVQLYNQRAYETEAVGSNYKVRSKRNKYETQRTDLNKVETLGQD